MNGGRGVLLQSAVASRGGNVVVDFVEVLLSGEDYGSIAFVGREDLSCFFFCFSDLKAALCLWSMLSGVLSVL